MGAKNFSALLGAIEFDGLVEFRLNTLVKFDSNPGKVFASYIVDLSHQTDANGDYVSDTWGDLRDKLKAALKTVCTGRMLKLHNTRSEICIETIAGDTL